MDESQVIYTFAVVIIAGILAGRAAEIYKFPRMIPLILTGLLMTIIASYTDIKFELDLIRELALLISELALVIVLYKEGMHIDLKTFRQNYLPIVILAVVGTFLTAFLVGLTISLIHVVEISFLAALLVGAIIAPTDPAATFSILRTGGTRIKERIGAIIGGESALNDVIAILLVIVVLVPQLKRGQGEPQFSFEILFLGFWSLLGGILLGIVVGAISIYIISFANKRSEVSFVSLTGMFIIFAFSIVIGVSSAIAALICGIIIRNPSYIRMNIFFTRSHLYDFWEDVTYLFEIMAFVFIGVLLNIDRLPHFILLGIVISIIVLSSRILSVFLTTLPLDIKSATTKILTHKERLFIGISGFKGLTTAILASYAFVNLESANEPLAEAILYSSLIVILVTGTFQGLIMQPSAKRTEVMEELDELDELKARKLAVEVELDKLVYDRSKERIRPADFRTLSFPLRDELYLIDERMRTLLAEEHAEKEFLEYQAELIGEALSSLEKAYEQDEIAEAAFKKIQSKYAEDLEELNFKLRVLAPIESTTETLIGFEETKDLDLMLAQDTVDSLSQNPNIAKKAPEIIQIQKMIKKVVKKLGRKRGTIKKSTKDSRSALPSVKVPDQAKTETRN